MARSTSIVTVCMNRRDQLLESARQVAAWTHHSEHLIVDWSSSEPLQREALPLDPRLRLLRVEGERHWNLARAYNFALNQARGDCLFKLDADCWPGVLPAPDQLAEDDRVCHFGSGPDGRLGQWLLDRWIWEQLGGFHELLQGYGFDDKELKARLMFQLGLAPKALPEQALGVIRHSVLLRAGDAGPAGPLEFSRARALKRTTSLANRVMAASCPWSAALPRSRYRQDPGRGDWSLESGTAPQPPESVRRELRRLRRETFWSEFLWIPAAVVRELPQRLLPAESDDGFRLTLGHRLLWWMLHLPWLPWVVLLGGCRGRLSWLRSRLSAGRLQLLRQLGQACRPLLATPLAAGLPAPLQRLALEARVERSLALGAPVALIWADLQRLQHRHGNHALVHRLLFRRGFRPRATADQVLLFQAIAADPQIPQSLRAYAQISLGYRSLKDNDHVLAQRQQAAIEAMALQLEADPATLHCGRGNRRNRLKLLVSCHTVLSHLQLLLCDEPGLRATAERLLALIEAVAWPQLPADVAYRLLTNAARGLGFAALLAWQEGSAQQLARIREALELLRRESVAERHLGSHAQEDHRGTVAQLQSLVAALVPGDRASARLLEEQLLNVRTPALQSQLEELLR